MIHCPYCGSEMPDDARSCPACKSMLVEGGDRRGSDFPRIFHPLAAAIAVILLSGGLLALSLGGSKNGGKSARNAPVEGENQPGPPPGAQRERETSDRRGEPANTASDNIIPASEYEQLKEYGDQAAAILEKAKPIHQEIMRAVTRNEKLGIPAITEKLREFQQLTSMMRSLKPPGRARRAHTRLANSLAIRQRGYRNMMVYLESGDIQRLDRGRSDMEVAEQNASEGLAEIEEMIETLEPERPEPEPEVSAPVAEPEPEPEASDESRVGADGLTEKERLELMERRRREAQERRNRRAGITPDRKPRPENEYLPEEPLPGETLYPEDGETVYPPEDDADYLPPEYDVYPEDEEPVYDEPMYEDDYYQRNQYQPGNVVPY